MNRAKLGSVLFFGILGVAFVLPREEAFAGGDRVSGEHRARNASDQVTPANAALKVTPDLGTTGKCPDGMVEVEGDYCSELEQKCTHYIDPEGVFPRRCAEFEKSSKCTGKTSKRHFCIDRFEWPNKAGENPV